MAVGVDEAGQCGEPVAADAARRAPASLRQARAGMEDAPPVTPGISVADFAEFDFDEDDDDDTEDEDDMGGTDDFVSIDGESEDE